MRYIKIFLIIITTTFGYYKIPTTFYSPPPVPFQNEIDTIFFEDFEQGIENWTFEDFTIQDTFWHISDTNAYAGHSFWCGTKAKPGWVQTDYGYGDEWAQFLISPPIDLSSVSGDSVFLTFVHRPSCEAAGTNHHWDGWDALTVWISTDDGLTWTPISPDTIRFPLTGYNVHWAWSWFWDILVNDSTAVPGWGLGANSDWILTGFDLTPYIGETIKLRFSGVSDPAESDQSGQDYNGMWYIDSITVIDNLNNTYLYEDCESGMNDWIAKPRDPLGNWWHLSSYQPYNGQFSLYCGDSLTHQFPSGGSYCAIISPSFSLAGLSTAEPCLLSFYTKYEYLSPYNAFPNLEDWFYIEVSTDNGETWDMVDYGYGSTGGNWVPKVVDLSYFIGVDSLKIRIINVNHSIYPNAGYGLYIDNITITGKFPEFPRQEQVLIYDDDINAIDFRGFGWEKIYESALANIGYRFLTISESSPGIPDSIYMRKNGMVIWNLGPKGYNWYGEPISEPALTQLKGYLRRGGKLLLVGQDYLANNCPNPFTDSFFPIVGFNEAVGCDTIIGIEQDPIGDGIYLPLDFNPLNGNGYGIDMSDDFSTTTTPVLLTNRTMGSVMLRHEANYRVVFSSFPIEALAFPWMRDTLLARIINWLDPTPPAPVMIKGTANPPQGIRLFWHQNPPQDLLGYNIYKADNPGGPFVLIHTTGPSDTTFVDTLVTLDSTYYYGVKAYDYSMQESWISNIVKVVYQVGIEEIVNPQSEVGNLKLVAFPNPFHKNLTIKFQTSYKKSTPDIKIYDATGRTVRDFSKLTMEGKNSTIIWDGKDSSGRRLPTGIYFIQLKSGNRRLTEKVVLLN